LLGSGQVHGHLSQAKHQEASAIDEAQASASKAATAFATLGDVNVGRVQETL